MKVFGLKKVIVVCILVLSVGFIGMRVVQNNTSPKLGVEAGMLKPLSSRPNSVSTQAKDESKRVDALVYSLPRAEQLEKVEKVILSMPGTQIVQRAEGYLHAVYTSKLMRFKDDVEVYLDDESKKLHFRSASRVGYSDLGVNRKRYQAFVARLNESK